MAENTVKIKFEGDSDKLTKAIKKLDTATKNLLKTQAKIIDNNNRNSRSTKRQSDGMRRLFIQLKANNKSFKDLGLSTNILTKAFKGNKIALEKVKIAIKKVKLEQEKADVTTRILGGTFAVLRSKLLLVGFAVGAISRPILNIVNLTTKLESVSQAFETLSGGTTKSSIAMNKLKEATDNTMSSFDLFKQANNAMILGVTKNSDEMAEMFDIAQRLGKALGRDTASSVESLITGIGRQSRLMLDNIGIIVKSEEAYEKYAKSIGTTASKLTDSQKKQAFFNATMESARAKVDSLGNESLTTQDVFAQLGVSFEEAGVSIGRTLTPAIVAMSGALKSGADTAKLFFDTINSILGLDEKVEELSINSQITFLKANLQSLVDEGLVDVDSAMSLFGKTMGALPFEESIFNVTELGRDAFITSEQINKMVSEIQRLSNLQDVQFQATAETFDIDTAKKASEELKILKENDERQEQNRVEMAKKVAEELKIISEEIANDEKRNQQIKKEIFGETVAFQIQQLNELEQAFLVFNEHTLESERFFEEQRNEIHAKALEKRLEKESAQSEFLISSTRKATDAYNSNIDSRVETDLAQLRKSVSYQEASATKRQSMEEKVSQKYADERKRVFAFEKLASLGEVAVDTAKAVQKSIALSPATFGAPFSAFALASGAIQAGAIMAQQPPSYESGGLIGGKRHSQGGTLIEAEQGEFVMSRSAVQAFGVEAMNQINQGQVGSISVNIQGNVIGNQEFVRDTLIPEIETTIRSNLA
tara:strand:- start:1183 stop:3474 length:2292 start_codon:yes stop_codon:yes gene_type:complete